MEKGTLYNFSDALTYMKEGQTMTRAAWEHSSGVRVSVQTPDKNSANTLPYLYMEKGEGETYKRFPLDLSCESLFAEDWQIVE